MSKNIIDALSQLDPTNDEHWTSDGSPRMDVVQQLLKDNSVIRKDVTDADPEFTRASAAAAKADAITALEAIEGQGEGEAPEAPEAPEDEAQATGEAPEDEAEPPAAPKDDFPEDGQAEVAEASPAEEAPKGKSDFGSVKDDDFYVMDMSMQEILSSRATMEAFQIESSAVTTEWMREKEKLTNNIEKISRLSAHITVQLQRMTKAASSTEGSEIQKYLARQAEVRELRAQRVKMFLEAGVDKKLFTEALLGKSKLDAALNMRKPARGSQRPQPRPIIQR